MKDRKKEGINERKKERKNKWKKEGINERKKERKEERKRLLSFALVLFAKASDKEQHAVANASKETALKDPATTLCYLEFEYTWFTAGWHCNPIVIRDFPCWALNKSIELLENRRNGSFRAISHVNWDGQNFVVCEKKIFYKNKINDLGL